MIAVFEMLQFFLIEEVSIYCSRTIVANSAILLILLSLIHSYNLLIRLEWPKTTKLILEIRRDTLSWLYSDPNHVDLSSASVQEALRQGHRIWVVKANVSLCKVNRKETPKYRVQRTNWEGKSCHSDLDF